MINQPLTADEIAAQLALFDKDPPAAMDRQPPKVVVQDPGRGTPLPFSGSVKSNAFVAQRDQVRKLACTERNGLIVRLDQVQPGRAPFLSNDLAENLVDVPSAEILRTLESMEQKGLLSARLKQSPWSSTYWPVFQGQLGIRYADPGYPAAQDWKKNRAYIEQHSAANIVASGDHDGIDNLSPAEKYDLLVGDDDYTLTQHNWNVGKRYYDSTGSVETWMGICHGWAPGAYMLPRPVKPLSLLAADGSTKITFFPADIKALGCLLWATTSPRTRFIGGRCNDKAPATDPTSGRVISPDCFDTNPGTWHLCMVNQIGVAQRSLVIDATFDYEVWNQPVLGYNYTYFNPQTRKPAASLKDARVERASLPHDWYAQWRAPNGKYLVGVSMRLTYIAETVPTHDSSDSASLDRLIQVDYLYDLELDAGGAIIGGEWYLNKHPDFIWTPPPGGQAMSEQDDAATGNWGGGPIPDAWGDAAAAASADGQPLGKIVNALFQMAK